MADFELLAGLKKIVDTDGQTLRRSVRRVGALTIKNDEGRILVARSDIRAVVVEAVRRGGVLRSGR